MPKWLVAVNRRAGRSSTSPAVIEDIVHSAGLDYQLVVPGTAVEMSEALVEAARQGVNHFALVGGDGTVSLAANALLPLDMGQPPVIGVLPVGTGCDLLRTFGLPQDVTEAARHLVTDDTYDIDVGLLSGEWGSRYFVNVAQAGVGAAAADTAMRIPRGWGPIRYPIAFLGRLPGFQQASITLTTERRVVESEALAVIFANAQFFAGGWNVAPKATMVDGRFDIQVFNCSKARAPALVPKIIKGNHLTDPAVRRLSAAEFTLSTEPMWPVEADGDLIGNTEVTGRVCRAAIRLKI